MTLVFWWAGSSGRCYNVSVISRNLFNRFVNNRAATGGTSALCSREWLHGVHALLTS
jgi:hypothetical protein